MVLTLIATEHVHETKSQLLLPTVSVVRQMLTLITTKSGAKIIDQNQDISHKHKGDTKLYVPENIHLRGIFRASHAIEHKIYKIKSLT